MITGTVMIYLVLNAALQWQLGSIVHLNGDGAWGYCETIRRQKAAEFNDLPGDERVVCGDDEGTET